MVTNRVGRFFLVLGLVGLLPLAAFADEVVHFTNGAEMTVKNHVVENDMSMVKVDLGGSSYISFPMTMVDKIVNAGKDVFLNPTFHPSNQAIAGRAVSVVADTTVRGVAGGSGYVPQPDGKGHAGTMLGEAADQVSGGAPMGALTNDTMAGARRRFNPARQQAAAPGGQPTLIMPPGMAAPPARAPAQLTFIGLPHAAEQQVPAPPPPANTPPPENPPAEDPAPEDPPDNP
jgi:hypothetical protein